MAVISAAYLKILEETLGDAYAQLKETQGANHLEDTVVYYVSKAKTIMRGGKDAVHGILPYTSTNDYEVGPWATGGASQWGVAYPTFSAYISGRRFTIAGDTYDPAPDGSLHLEGGGEMAGSDDGSFVRIQLSVGDSSYITTAGAIVASYSTNTYISKEYYFYQGGASFTGPPAIMTHEQVPTYEVKFAEYYPVDIEYAGNLAYEYEPGYKDSIYQAPPTGPDEPIVDIFSDIDTVDATQVAKTRDTELQSALTALENHYTKRAGMSFFNYAKAAGYTFSNNFREFYADIKSTDLPVNLLKLQSLTFSPTITDGKLYNPCNLEVIMKSTGGACTAQVDVFAIRNTKTVITAKNPWLASNYQLPVASVSSWPSTDGYLSIKENIGSDVYWRVASYNKLNATTLTLGFITSSVSNEFIPNVTEVFLTDKIPVYFTPSAAVDSTQLVGTITYVAAGYLSATGGTAGTLASSAGYWVRNR